MSVASKKRRRRDRRHARGVFYVGELRAAAFDGTALFARTLERAAKRHEDLIADALKLAAELGPTPKPVIAIVHPDDVAALQRSESPKYYAGGGVVALHGIPIHVTPEIAPGKPLVLPKSDLLAPKRWR